MKHPFFKVCLLAASVAIAGCQQQEGDAVDSADVELDTQERQISYILGANVASQFVSQEMEVDVDAFQLGFEDVILERESRLSEESVRDIISTYQEEETARMEEAYQVVADANAKEGQEFLAANAQEDGVVVLDSGLQYRVIEAGEGATPDEDDLVEVDYRGRLIDGTEFDSSYQRGVPATFGVNQVIPGWTEVLQLMQEGAKWEVFIPSDLAYGPGGTGGLIGPNATLIFEIELHEVLGEESGEDAAEEASSAD